MRPAAHHMRPAADNNTITPRGTYLLGSTHRSAGRTAWPLQNNLEPFQAMLHTQAITRQHHRNNIST